MKGIFLLVCGATSIVMQDPITTKKNQKWNILDVDDNLPDILDPLEWIKPKANGTSRKLNFKQKAGSKAAPVQTSSKVEKLSPVDMDPSMPDILDPLEWIKPKRNNSDTMNFKRKADSQAALAQANGKDKKLGPEDMDPSDPDFFDPLEWIELVNLPKPTNGTSRKLNLKHKASSKAALLHKSSKDVASWAQ